MADHKTVCIVGIVFQCILFIIFIVGFCDLDCIVYDYNNRRGCIGMYTGIGDSGIQASRAFHILGFLACIGAIVTWSLFFAHIWDYKDGYISIITFTSAELLFAGLTACIWTGEGYSNSDGVVAIVWITFAVAIAPFVCALLIAMGKTGKDDLCGECSHKVRESAKKDRERQQQRERERKESEKNRKSQPRRGSESQWLRKESRPKEQRQQQPHGLDHDEVEEPQQSHRQHSPHNQRQSNTTSTHYVASHKKSHATERFTKQ